MTMPWEVARQQNEKNKNTALRAPAPVRQNIDMPPWERAKQQNERQYRSSRTPTYKESVNYFINRNPVERFTTPLRGIAQKIPIVGNYISTTPEMLEEERHSPISTTVMRNLGGAAATYPLFATLPRAGSLAKQIWTTGLTGAGLNIADSYTSENPPQSPREAAVRGIFGFVGAGGPSVLARGIYPAGVRSRPIRPEPNITGPGASPNSSNTFARQADEMADIPFSPGTRIPQLDRVVRNQGLTSTAQETADKLAPYVTGIATGALGHMLTNDPSTALLLGAGGYGGHRAMRGIANTRVGKEYFGRKMDPELLAITNALASVGINNLNDAPRSQSNIPTLGN